MEHKRKKYHYLYKTTNLMNNKYYYGIHSTNNLEDGYLGSGKRLRYSIRKYGKDNFKKEILSYYNSREELSNAEKTIITKDILQDKYCMNIIYGGEEWNTIGMTAVKDKNGNTFKVFCDDPRYLSGELVGITKGTVSVKDKDGNTFKVSIFDEKYLSGELVGISKNTITVKDKNNNTSVVDKNDSRYLSGELVGIWKNKKHSIDSINKMKETKKGTGLGELNSQFGTKWINKNNINKKIKKEELDQYLSDGWFKGISK